MKKVFATLVIFGSVSSAFGQQKASTGTSTGTTQPGMQQSGQPGMQQGGQPGMQQGGQPGMQQGGQPGMQQGGQPGMQQGGQPGMQQGGQPGMQQSGSKPVEAWPVAKCEKELTKAKKAADNCIKIKAADKRSACFNEMGQKFPQGFEEGCRAQVEPVKMEYMNKEKQMYPNQQGSFGQGGGNGGPQSSTGQNGMQPQQAGMQQPNGSSGNSGMQQPKNNVKPASPAECSKYESKIKKEADACLKQKAADKRKSCFDKVGEMISKENIEGKCPEMMNSLKSVYQSKEAQLYPKDPPSIQ